MATTFADDDTEFNLVIELVKTERTARRTYRTRDAARADVFNDIERFYNGKRGAPPSTISAL
jgi:putative transposase